MKIPKPCRDGIQTQMLLSYLPAAVWEHRSKETFCVRERRNLWEDFFQMTALQSRWRRPSTTRLTFTLCRPRQDSSWGNRQTVVPRPSLQVTRVWRWCQILPRQDRYSQSCNRRTRADSALSRLAAGGRKTCRRLETPRHETFCLTRPPHPLGYAYFVVAWTLQNGEETTVETANFIIPVTRWIYIDALLFLPILIIFTSVKVCTVRAAMSQTENCSPQ